MLFPFMVWVGTPNCRRLSLEEKKRVLQLSGEKVQHRKYQKFIPIRYEKNFGSGGLASASLVGLRANRGQGSNTSVTFAKRRP